MPCFAERHDVRTKNSTPQKRKRKQKPHTVHFSMQQSTTPRHARKPSVFSLDWTALHNYNSIVHRHLLSLLHLHLRLLLCIRLHPPFRHARLRRAVVGLLRARCVLVRALRARAGLGSPLLWGATVVLGDGGGGRVGTGCNGHSARFFGGGGRGVGAAGGAFLGDSERFESFLFGEVLEGLGFGHRPGRGFLVLGFDGLGSQW
mmetsp:Transcript_13976/g.37349  ORF Transcript_13976/g.37349 Transcript_13976/m.37349 type:complete len:203 (-) Transcript_13976:1237-1845(-)